MKAGILCASDDELAPFLSSMQCRTVLKKAKLTFHCGKIANVDAVAVFSGVCKVNAAIAAQILIDTFKADVVVNSGTTGGMDPKLEILDTAISTEVAYHDVSPDILTDFHPWMKTEFFSADAKLLELSKEAVKARNKPQSVLGQNGYGRSLYRRPKPTENQRQIRPFKRGHGNRRHRSCLLCV